VRTNKHANLHAQPRQPAAAYIHHDNNNKISTTHCMATCQHLPTYPPTRAHPSHNDADATNADATNTRLRATRPTPKHPPIKWQYKTRTHALRVSKRTSDKAARHTPRNTSRRVACSPWPSSSDVPCRTGPRQAEQPATQASRQSSDKQINRHKQHHNQTSAASAVAILTNNKTIPHIGRRQQRANKHTR
jgi:hypothetical protein